jgi:hypothetical protein
MAVTIDPPRSRVVPAWDSSRVLVPVDPSPSAPLPSPIDAGILPLAGGVRSRDPAWPDLPDPPERAAPVPPAATGLYDLPGLLARIWSVPVHRRTPAPLPLPTDTAPAPPEPLVPVRPVPSLTGGSSPWTAVSDHPVLSLPLAAVPSLTFRPPTGAEPDRRPNLTAPAEGAPSYLPALQYVAWRRPPCHQPYGSTFLLSHVPHHPLDLMGIRGSGASPIGPRSPAGVESVVPRAGPNWGDSRSGTSEQPAD